VKPSSCASCLAGTPWRRRASGGRPFPRHVVDAEFEEFDPRDAMHPEPLILQFARRGETPAERHDDEPMHKDAVPHSAGEAQTTTTRPNRVDCARRLSRALVRDRKYHAARLTARSYAGIRIRTLPRELLQVFRQSPPRDRVRRADREASGTDGLDRGRTATDLI